jgi:RNA polymerase sigma factor (sigma-70 family)
VFPRRTSGTAHRKAPRSTGLRNRLVLDHLRLVRPIARRIHSSLPPSFDVEDLVSAGILGLIDAAARAHSPLGQFTPFARQRIRGAILDSVRRSQYRDATHAPLDAVSHASTPSIETDAIEREMDIQRCFVGLTSAEARLLSLYYWERSTIEAAGTTLGMTLSAASRMHLRALAKLRAAFEWDDFPQSGDLSSRVPKLAQTKSSKTPQDRLRAQVIDELGALQEQIKPQIAREKTLVAEIRGWAEQECKPASAVVYEGRIYLAPVSAKGNRRRVAEMAQVFAMLGRDTFLRLCGFTVETAEKHLSPLQFTEVVVEDANVGPRAVSTVLRAAAVARKKKAA